jgi:hypothetical protein
LESKRTIESSCHSERDVLSAPKVTFCERAMMSMSFSAFSLFGKEEETSENYCSLKVPIDHTDKESKTYTVKVKRYDSGPPEEFLKWRLILAEQIKNNGYGDNADNSMNLAQAMLAGRSLDVFLNEKRAQDAKNRVRKSKTIAEHTPKQIFYFALFELLI